VSVVLYPTRVDFQGKRVDAIRIDKAAAAAPKPARRPAPAPANDEFVEDDGLIDGDGIPF
jgi:hypothetical protein